MKKMLVVCDVEGTIFKAKYRIEGTEYASSMWQPLAHTLGMNAEREEYETHLKWENQEYDNYVDWVKATVNIHRRYGLKKEIFFRLINEAEYMPGVQEFFKRLDRQRFVPVLITGGFRNLARRAEKELKIESANIFAACNYSFDMFGNLAEVDIQPCDFDDKITCVKTVLDNYELDFDKDWIFIGDGKNDIPIAEMAPYRLGINPHNELKPYVDKSIDGFLEAVDEIETFYDIVNSEPSSQEDLEKIKKRAVNRTIGRERIVKENIALRKEIDKLKKRIETLESTFPKPTTIEAIIPFAEYYYGENITFSKEAKESLIKNAEAGYTEKYIEGVFEQLKYINLWARMMKGEITRKEYDSAVSNKKITYALSESTEHKFKEEYTENGVLINMHMYMSWLPNCDRPRTYFGWDKKHNKALVSTMCEHKRTERYK